MLWHREELWELLQEYHRHIFDVCAPQAGASSAWCAVGCRLTSRLRQHRWTKGTRIRGAPHETERSHAHPALRPRDGEHRAKRSRSAMEKARQRPASAQCEPPTPAIKIIITITSEMSSFSNNRHERVPQREDAGKSGCSHDDTS